MIIFKHTTTTNNNNRNMERQRQKREKKGENKNKNDNKKERREGRKAGGNGEAAVCGAESKLLLRPRIDFSIRELCADAHVERKFSFGSTLRGGTASLRR
ncbi:50S ribosomal subunit protein L19 [Candidatus Hodgkinia cicadicola]|nr:50S ribosomal subunit protein L19 [Candidatus Hodgkinia cicadicola]